MSTRANLVFFDAYGDKAILYRHSDGYPEGVLETLGKWCKAVNEGIIRDNVEQSLGWLILLGAEEYGVDISSLLSKESKSFNSWKSGAYEISTTIHSDIEYLYMVDLEKREVNIYTAGWDEFGANSPEEVSEGIKTKTPVQTIMFCDF